MNPLLKEIEDEMKRTRLDKTRLYGLLAKIVESCPHAVSYTHLRAHET